MQNSELMDVQTEIKVRDGCAGWGEGPAGESNGGAVAGVAVAGAVVAGTTGGA